MGRILCSVGSMTQQGRVAIPVSVFIPQSDWNALAEWTAQVAAEHPTLAGLLAPGLPKTIEIDSLLMLRDELSRIPRGLPKGPALAALDALDDYCETANNYVGRWRASGSSTKLTAAVQLLKGDG